jgi:hypothetical protein
MLPVGLAVGAVVLLLWRGVKRSLDPTIKEDAERAKLKKLRSQAVLNIDQAEDGLVLARRYHDATAAQRFQAAVVELRKRRVRI